MALGSKPLWTLSCDDIEKVTLQYDDTLGPHLDDEGNPTRLFDKVGVPSDDGTAIVASDTLMARNNGREYAITIRHPQKGDQLTMATSARSGQSGVYIGPLVIEWEAVDLVPALWPRGERETRSVSQLLSDVVGWLNQLVQSGSSRSLSLDWSTSGSVVANASISFEFLDGTRLVDVAQVEENPGAPMKIEGWLEIPPHRIVQDIPWLANAQTNLSSNVCILLKGLSSDPIANYERPIRDITLRGAHPPPIYQIQEYLVASSLGG